MRMIWADPPRNVGRREPLILKLSSSTFGIWLFCVHQAAAMKQVDKHSDDEPLHTIPLLYLCSMQIWPKSSRNHPISLTVTQYEYMRAGLVLWLWMSCHWLWPPTNSPHNNSLSGALVPAKHLGEFPPQVCDDALFGWHQWCQQSGFTVPTNTNSWWDAFVPVSLRWVESWL